MSKYGMDIVDLFGEEDARLIAIMYVKLYHEIGDISFAQQADGIIEVIREIDRDKISEWIEKEGVKLDKADQTGS